MQLRIARITLLRRADGGKWRILRREDRPDLPLTLHVGMIAYTDYDSLKWDLIFNDVSGYNECAVEGGVPAELRASVLGARSGHAALARPMRR